MAQLSNLTKSELVAMIAKIIAEQSETREEFKRVVDRVSEHNKSTIHRLYLIENRLQSVEDQLHALQNPPKRYWWTWMTGE